MKNKHVFMALAVFMFAMAFHLIIYPMYAPICFSILSGAVIILLGLL